MLVEFEQNRMVQTTRKFELLTKKKQTNKQTKKRVFKTSCQNKIFFQNRGRFASGYLVISL